MKKALFLLLTLVLLASFCLSSCKKDTPENDSGTDKTQSMTPTIDISPDGYWIINGVKTNEYYDPKYAPYSEDSTSVYGIHLFSDLETLKKSGNNNGILAIREFRRAFSLALNRIDIIEKIWSGKCTPCLSPLNAAYYYDFESSSVLADGGKYRYSVQAKDGMLRAYGYTQDTEGYWAIGTLEGLTLDEAYEALTGYNIDLAKQELRAAIDILLANPEFYGYNSHKRITLVYGAPIDNDKQRFRAQYLQGVIDKLTAGTVLEGEIKIKFDTSAADQWAEAFRAGDIQIGFGYGFQGDALNPFYTIGSFINPDDDLNYHQYWDTSGIDLTLTMPINYDHYDGAGETITMSILNWYYCLNGLAEENNQPKTYNWGESFAPSEARLSILSALEKAILNECHYIVLFTDYRGVFDGEPLA